MVVKVNFICFLLQDYADAFNNLIRLGLKKQPEQEIIHVIVDVCLQEKTYNAFYTYLLRKFCEYDRRFQVRMLLVLFMSTLQFNYFLESHTVECSMESFVHKDCRS